MTKGLFKLKEEIREEINYHDNVVADLKTMIMLLDTGAAVDDVKKRFKQIV